MLIDCSYFTKGPRHILNASMGKLPNPNAMEVNAAIEAYICGYQPEWLRRMCGDNVGPRLHAYLVCLDEDEEPRRIASLDAVCDRLREAFADYVFYRILRDAGSQATVTGLVQLKCANTYVSPIRRQVSAWRDMVGRNRDFVQWCRSGECPIGGITTDEDMTTCINTLNL